MNQLHVLVAVSGGIAAYKACALISSLSKKGYDVKVVMSDHAREFVSEINFAALSHNPVYTSEFNTPGDPIPHISLAKWADVLIVAPATANTIAKAVYGIGDNLMTSTFLACTCPKILCPAMNVHMYENPVTQANIARARELGWQIVEPEAGLLACQEEGKGRLPETEVMIEAIEKALNVKKPDQNIASLPLMQSEDLLLDELMDQDHPLAGKHVLVNAGPTCEPFDPVRFVTNHSSGKQGYAIAADARDWGAQVILVSGPVSLPEPEGIKTIHVTTACEMEKAIMDNEAWADFIIMAAAVADYRPKTVADQKMKKSDESMVVEFVKNPDILKQLGLGKRKDQVLCGFAMETQNLDQNARAKLEAKNCDLLIANNLTTSGAGFQSDTNVVSLLKKDSVEHLPKMSKEQLGFVILAQMVQLQKGAE